MRMLVVSTFVAALATMTPQASALATADTQPVAIKEVKPAYPKAALKDKKQGTVLVVVEVKTDGTVGSAKVTQSLSPALDAEAVKAAKQWRFKPATKDGKAVPADTTLEMVFAVK
jgi:TonB family protein